MTSRTASFDYSDSDSMPGTASVVSSDCGSFPGSDTCTCTKQTRNAFWKLWKARAPGFDLTESSSDNDGSTYVLRRSSDAPMHATAAGVFWRPSPQTRKARQCGEAPAFTAWRKNHPRESALLKGHLVNVRRKTKQETVFGTQTWLIVTSVKNPGQRQWRAAPNGAALPWNLYDEGYTLDYFNEEECAN